MVASGIAWATKGYTGGLAMFRPGIVGVTVLAATFISADVVFYERFDENPCASSSGWVCRGDAVWVAPDAAPCPSDDPALFAPW